MQRANQVFFALVVLGLIGTSCAKDHEVPAKIYPTVVTKELTHGSPTSTFRLQFTDLGNVPITEYGIALSKGISGQLVATPTVANETLVFSTPPTDLNIKSQTYGTTFADANYRAYARLQDGTIVYGNVLMYRFQPL